MRLPIRCIGIVLKLIVAGLCVSIGPAAVAAPPQAGIAKVPPPIATEFVRCVAERHHREATDYVLRRTASRVQAAARARRKLADEGCVPADATGEDARNLLSSDKEDQLRPLLAEALVRADYPTFDATRISTAQPLNYGKLVDDLFPPGACKGCKPAKRKEFEQARAHFHGLFAPLVFGECVARTDPASTHKMLLSDAGSPQESAAIDALQPTLEHCVVQGVQFKIDVMELRKSLALNYYRLAQAPRMHDQGLPRRDVQMRSPEREHPLEGDNPNRASANHPVPAEIAEYQQWTDCLVSAAHGLLASSEKAEKIVNASFGKCMDHELRARWKFEVTTLQRGLKIPDGQLDVMMDNGRKTLRRLLVDFVKTERLKTESHD